MTKKSVTFILSVDTEEEWDWSGPFPNQNFCVDNVNEIPAFQNYCQELGIKPTYLVDYAVADDKNGASILKKLNKAHCEIGAHLHPWANPPFFDETSEESSHVIHLPIKHVEAKLVALKEIIETNIGCTPLSFRTGRWGISGPVLTLLSKYGFKTDSSIYPLYQNEYFSCEKAPHHQYWPDLTNTNNIGQQRDIFEMPVTCGFNRTPFNLAQPLHKLMEKVPFRWLRINGILWHSRLLQKIYLSPELCTSRDMKRLIDTCLKRGQTVFHMYLHSSSLIEDVTGLHNDHNARETICQRIAEVSTYLQSKADVTFKTLSEASEDLTRETP